MMLRPSLAFQVQVAQFINGEMPGLPRPVSAAKPIRGLCQRLKGKSGRFRGNLSGKRVRIVGLTSKSELNDRYGRVTAYNASHLLFEQVLNGYATEGAEGEVMDQIVLVQPTHGPFA